MTLPAIVRIEFDIVPGVQNRWCLSEEGGVDQTRPDSIDALLAGLTALRIRLRNRKPAPAVEADEVVIASDFLVEEPKS